MLIQVKPSGLVQVKAAIVKCQALLNGIKGDRVWPESVCKSQYPRFCEFTRTASKYGLIALKDDVWYKTHDEPAISVTSNKKMRRTVKKGDGSALKPVFNTSIETSREPKRPREGSPSNVRKVGMLEEKGVFKPRQEFTTPRNIIKGSRY